MQPRIVTIWTLSLSLLLGNWLCAQNKVRVRLKDDGIVSGRLVPNYIPTKHGGLALESEAFVEPLEFDIDAIKAVDLLEGTAKAPQGEQLLILQDGNFIGGKLLSLDADKIVVESRTLGQVSIPRNAVSELVSARSLGLLRYAGPRGNEWRSVSNPNDWAFEAGSIASSKIGASILGDVNLPDRCEVRISLSWTREPDFSISLGCDADGKNEKEAAVRLEIWDGDLAIVRESDSSADLALVSNLSKEDNRLDMIICIDQTAGLAAACDANGRVLKKVELKPEQPIVKSFAKLSNFTNENYKSILRLERFEVREWDGQLLERTKEQGNVVLTKQKSIKAEIVGFDPDTRSVKFSGSELPSASLDEIAYIAFDSDKSGKAAGHPKRDAAFCEVELEDRSHLIGNWLSSDKGQVTFLVSSISEPLKFNSSVIVSLDGNEESYTAFGGLSENLLQKLAIGERDLKNNRYAKLTCEDIDLNGELSQSEGETKLLRWQPSMAMEPVTLSGKKPGKISFPQKELSARIESNGGISGNVILNANNLNANNLNANNLNNVNNLNNPIPLVRMRPAVRTAEPNFQAARPMLPIGLSFRTGDTVNGQVEQIDEKGVTFKSNDTKTTFVPHESLEGVVLKESPVFSSTPEKTKRLLTVPRAAKSDPPTHLLVSITGDFLRGRLISLNAEKAVMEIRLEMVEIPTEKIAQIFWLYDRTWEDEQEPKDASQETQEVAKLEPAVAEGTLRLFIVRKDNKALSLLPTQITRDAIMGSNEFLGDCQIPNGELVEVHFGSDLSKIAKARKKDPWQLTLATLPRTHEESSESSGESSPLVGKPAPQFQLPKLEGDRLNLSTLKGRIVVLDFWASWCGPCIQTMPEIERVVNELGGNEKIELIAINLQESKDRVAAAVKRLNLKASVVLDSEGDVARSYDATAIPQTVIIDREGNVAHLFIGGGPRIVTQFEEALSNILTSQSNQ